MEKKKTDLKNLGKQHTKDYLASFYPFLRNDFRELKANELKSEKVLKELFGEDETDFNKLAVVYEYQK
jgi:hypothetical protein